MNKQFRARLFAPLTNLRGSKSSFSSSLSRFRVHWQISEDLNRHCSRPCPDSEFFARLEHARMSCIVISSITEWKRERNVLLVKIYCTCTAAKSNKIPRKNRTEENKATTSTNKTNQTPPSPKGLSPTVFICEILQYFLTFRPMKRRATVGLASEATDAPHLIAALIRFLARAEIKIAEPSGSTSESVIEQARSIKLYRCITYVPFLIKAGPSVQL